MPYVSELVQFFSDIDISLKSNIEALKHIDKVSALIIGASPVNDLPIVGVYGVSPDRFDLYALTIGDYPKQNEVILGEKIYKILNTPKNITISKKKFKVSGVFKSKIGFEDGGVVMGLDDASKIFHKSVSLFLVSLDSPEKGNTIADINALSDEIEANTTDNFIDNYNQFKIIKTSADAISALAFLMGVLGIISMMSMVVNDRKIEFGVMRSLGLSNSTIIIKLISETLIVALFAYLFAGILSYLILEFITHMEKFQGYISGEITSELAINVFFISIIMAMLGSLLPAIWASRIDPMSLILQGSAR